MGTIHTWRSAVVLSLIAMLAVGSSTTVPIAAAKDPATAAAVPVVGTATGTLAGVFNGTATNTNFVLSNGQLNAVGTLIGTITDTGTLPDD